MKILFSLFWTFFKIGLFTFGGGMAMLPLIEEQVVNRKKWITDEDMLDILAISESTPGPIAINSATFIGCKTRGFFGALFATIGVVLPSLIIITVISFFIEEFLSWEWVGYAFMGIRAAVAILILSSVVKLYQKSKKYWFTYVLAVAACVVTLVFPKFSTIYVIIIGALAGVILQIIQAKIESNKNDSEGGQVNA